MRSAALLAALAFAAPAAGMSHELRGMTSYGAPMLLTVDAHLQPMHLRMALVTRHCNGWATFEHPVDLGSFDALHLIDQRLEHGVLHKHWSGGRLAIHVSRHADGSVHAQGSASFDAYLPYRYGGGPMKLCLFSGSFVTHQ